MEPKSLRPLTSTERDILQMLREFESRPIRTQRRLAERERLDLLAARCKRPIVSAVTGEMVMMRTFIDELRAPAKRVVAFNVPPEMLNREAAEQR